MSISLLVNGNGGCGEWQPIGGLTAQVDWLSPRDDSQLVPNYIHQMNQVNSRDARPGIRWHYKYCPLIIIFYFIIIISKALEWVILETIG